MTSAPTSSLPRPKDSVVWTELPDGAVLFATDAEVYYSLNEVGAVVWDLLATGTPSLDALCGDVLARFPDAEPDEVRADVTELIADLLRAGLLEAR